MKSGDQIAYIPDHAKGMLDIEFGFVWAISQYNNEKIFCRYWIIGRPGDLRTVANSELTDLRDLILYQSVPAEIIAETTREIKNARQ